ncbi:MAG: OmpA family protein [Granulosicoccus sp.]
MSADSLHFELPPEERPSLVPWIIILACAAILMVLLSQLARQIPASLLQQAQSQLDSTTFPDLRLAANGRDLELSGAITIDQSTTSLIDGLRQINGVRDVREAIQVIDPAVASKARLARFAASLAAIDTSLLAFQPGSTSLTPESDNALVQLLTLLKEHPESRIRIEGHTDNTGPDTVNLRVSRERAGAVANYLMARGIPSDQLIVTGYGSTQPVADNETDSGRARNRRIEINPVN